MKRKFWISSFLTIFFATLIFVFAGRNQYALSLGMLAACVISAFCAYGEYNDSKQLELHNQPRLNLETPYHSAPEGDTTLND